MFALIGRSALLTGALVAALAACAWSADGETPKSTARGPTATGTEPPTAMATSSPTDPGISDQRLFARAGAHVGDEVGETQPTRGQGNLRVVKRYNAGVRPRVGYARPAHRYSLILGIGY
jgi:hypothetical protein